MNMADPMYDEQKSFADDLTKAKANLVVMDHKGMHCSIGGPYDLEAHRKDMKVWARSIFSPKK
jgi:hypothetical protein